MGPAHWATEAGGFFGKVKEGGIWLNSWRTLCVFTFFYILERRLLTFMISIEELAINVSVSIWHWWERGEAWEKKKKKEERHGKNCEPMSGVEDRRLLWMELTMRRQNWGEREGSGLSIWTVNASLSERRKGNSEHFVHVSPSISFMVWAIFWLEFSFAALEWLDTHIKE